MNVFKRLIDRWTQHDPWWVRAVEANAAARRTERLRDEATAAALALEGFTLHATQITSPEERREWQAAQDRYFVLAAERDAAEGKWERLAAPSNARSPADAVSTDEPSTPIKERTVIKRYIRRVRAARAGLRAVEAEMVAEDDRRRRAGEPFFEDARYQRIADRAELAAARLRAAWLGRELPHAELGPPVNAVVDEADNAPGWDAAEHDGDHHPHEPSAGVEQTQPIRIHPLQLYPPGDERYEQATQAVRDAEARLEQIHAEHHQLMSSDPEWDHSLREPEPDWPGGVASAEELESWARHLQDCADRREAEAAQAHADDQRRRAEWREREQAAEEWDRSPYNPANYRDGLDWYLNNPHRSDGEAVYRRVGTDTELDEALSEAFGRSGGQALIECEEFDPTAPDHHSETAVQVDTGPSAEPVSLPWLHMRERGELDSASQHNPDRGSGQGADTRPVGHAGEFDRVLAGIDEVLTPMGEAEARGVLAEADELIEHLDSCEVGSEQCQTCGPEVDGSREEFWRNRVPAAESVVDRAESAALLDPPEFDELYDTAAPAQGTEQTRADAGERDAAGEVLWPGADGTRILAKQRVVRGQVVAEYCDPDGFVIGESTRPLAQGESADQVADHFIDSLPEQATRPRFGPSITPEHQAALDRHHPNDPEVTRERAARVREQARAASPELAALWERATNDDGHVSMADWSQADARAMPTAETRDLRNDGVNTRDAGEGVAGPRGLASWTDRLLREVSSPRLSHSQRIEHLDRYAEKAWDPDAVKAAKCLARSMEIARADIEPIAAPGQPQPELTPAHTRAILDRARADMAGEVAVDAAERADQRHARLSRETEAAREAQDEAVEHATRYESPDERDRRHAAQARYEALVQDRDAGEAPERETTRERANHSSGCGPAVAEARQAVDRLCHQPVAGDRIEGHDSPRQVRHAEAAGDAADEDGWSSEGGLER